MTLFGESQPFEENMLLLVVAIMHGYMDIQELGELVSSHRGNFSKMLPLKVPNHKQKNKIRLFKWDANYSRNCTRKRRAALGPI